MLPTTYCELRNIGKRILNMKAMSETKYPLQWLDRLIDQIKSYPTEESNKTDSISQIRVDVRAIAEKEINNLKLRIREEIFVAAAPKKNRKLVANYYHETITYYMNVLYGIGQDCEAHIKQADDQRQILHNLLGQLLSYLEIHFRDYLKSNRKVPKYDLLSVKQTLRDLLDGIGKRRRKLKCTHTQTVIGIVTKSMEKFISHSKYRYTVTHQCVQYRLELLTKIQSLNKWEPDPGVGQFPLDSLLIFMNFNSKTYINYLTSCLSESMINANDSDKIELLLGYYKGFRQLHSNPNYAFNPEYHNIMVVLDKWFDEELSYFSKMVTLSPASGEKPQNNTLSERTQPVKSKVLCTLSGDQIALLLRAADEVRMLSARSLTAVFRNIVPHLSTKQTEELSYESIRIKSYNAEQTDKEVTIRTLNKMIEKIKEY